MYFKGKLNEFIFYKLHFFEIKELKKRTKYEPKTNFNRSSRDFFFLIPHTFGLDTKIFFQVLSQT